MSTVTGSIGNISERSQFHERCVPAPPTPLIDGPSQTRSGRAGDCDPTSRDKIWRQTIENETRLNKSWNENWGFMTDYDQKGNLKKKEPLPSDVSLYSSSIPVTNSKIYGCRLSTETGRNLLTLEHNLCNGQGKKKTEKDIITY